MNQNPHLVSSNEALEQIQRKYPNASPVQDAPYHEFDLSIFQFFIDKGAKKVRIYDAQHADGSDSRCLLPSDENDVLMSIPLNEGNFRPFGGPSSMSTTDGEGTGGDAAGNRSNSKPGTKG